MLSRKLQTGNIERISRKESQKKTIRIGIEGIMFSAIENCNFVVVKKNGKQKIYTTKQWMGFPQHWKMRKVPENLERRCGKGNNCYRSTIMTGIKHMKVRNWRTSQEFLKQYSNNHVYYNSCSNVTDTVQLGYLISH